MRGGTPNLLALAFCLGMAVESVIGGRTGVALVQLVFALIQLPFIAYWLSAERD